MKFGQEANMSTNVCEALHKIHMKRAGRQNNQHSNMCKQVLQRNVERARAADACYASDIHHGLDDAADLWDNLAARRLYVNADFVANIFILSPKYCKMSSICLQNVVKLCTKCRCLDIKMMLLF